MKSASHLRDDEVVLSGVSKRYETGDGKDVLAVTEFSLSVRDREFVSIVGPSGCGKTTVLRMLAGLAKPSTGSMRIAGREVDGPDSGMAMVFQNPTLLPWETVLKNILLPVRIKKGDVARARQHADELLAMTGLEDFAKRYPVELSGGMQQRVAIGRALISRPSLLLLDEPFGALDALTRDQMNLELMRIWEQTKTTVILITHSVPEGVFLADRVVVMTPRPGRISTVVSVDAARPRDLSMLGQPILGNYTKQVRETLDADHAI